MQYIKIREIPENLNEKVILKGWIRNYRKAGRKLRFVIIRDGSGEVQCVASKPDMGDNRF